MEKEDRKKLSIFFVIILFFTTIPFQTVAKAKSLDERIHKDIFKKNEIIKKLERNKNLSENPTKITRQKRYYVKIVNGISINKKARLGEEVDIFANQLQDKEFIGWKSKQDIEFKNIKNQSTSFIMPSKNVEIVASYKEFDSGSIDEESEEVLEEIENEDFDLEEVEEDNKTKNKVKKRKKSKRKLNETDY